MEVQQVFRNTLSLFGNWFCFTAKRLRPTAQGCRCGYPGLLSHVVSNPERVASASRNRVAVGLTIQFQTQGSRSGNPGL